MPTDLIRYGNGEPGDAAQLPNARLAEAMTAWKSGRLTLSGESTDDDAIAEAPVSCFLQTVPAAVPGIVFLSGGQIGPYNPGTATTSSGIASGGDGSLPASSGSNDTGA